MNIKKVSVRDNILKPVEVSVEVEDIGTGGKLV